MSAATAGLLLPSQASHCFDTVGWVVWPVITVPEMTLMCSSGVLSLYTLKMTYFSMLPSADCLMQQSSKWTALTACRAPPDRFVCLGQFHPDCRGRWSLMGCRASEHWASAASVADSHVRTDAACPDTVSKPQPEQLDASKTKSFGKCRTNN